LHVLEAGFVCHREINLPLAAVIERIGRVGQWPLAAGRAVDYAKVDFTRIAAAEVLSPSFVRRDGSAGFGIPVFYDGGVDVFIHQHGIGGAAAATRSPGGYTAATG
jgi:hypothetical protein